MDKIVHKAYAHGTWCDARKTYSNSEIGYFWKDVNCKECLKYQRKKSPAMKLIRYRILLERCENFIISVPTDRQLDVVLPTRNERTPKNETGRKIIGDLTTELEKE